MGKYNIALLICLAISLFFAQTSFSHHNEEFPINGCDTPDDILTIEIYSFYFEVNGIKIPDIIVKKGSCLKVVTTNHKDIEHDFTVVYDNVHQLIILMMWK